MTRASLAVRKQRRAAAAEAVAAEAVAAAWQQLDS